MQRLSMNIVVAAPIIFDSSIREVIYGTVQISQPPDSTHCRRRAMGLGSANTIFLVDARELAMEARKAVSAGSDPIAERKKARARAITFFEAAEQCRADIGAKWKAERYRQNWLSSLTIHAKSLASKTVGEITADHVEQVMRPLWSKQPDL